MELKERIGRLKKYFKESGKNEYLYFSGDRSEENVQKIVEYFKKIGADVRKKGDNMYDFFVSDRFNGVGSFSLFYSIEKTRSNGYSLKGMIGELYNVGTLTIEELSNYVQYYNYIIYKHKKIIGDLEKITR